VGGGYVAPNYVTPYYYDQYVNGGTNTVVVPGTNETIRQEYVTPLVEPTGPTLAPVPPTSGDGEESTSAADVPVAMAAGETPIKMASN